MTYSYEHHPGQATPEHIQGEGFSSVGTEAKENQQTNDELFLNLLSLPHEKVDELRPQLYEITEQALSTTINPHDQDALIITTKIIDWRLFGEPNSPLPFGLMQGHSKENAYLIRYDVRTGFDAGCAHAAMRKLGAAGLWEIEDDINKLMEERSDQLKEAFVRTIEASQAFQFMSTLANGELPQQKEEHPLTPFWRTVREAQINQKVRTRWSLEPQEPIIPYTEPDYDLRRELSRLDDETAPAPTKPNDDPLTDLRSYLEGLVQTEFAKSFPNEDIVEVTRNNQGDKIIHTAQHPEGNDQWDYLWDYMQAVAHTIALQLNETGPHVQVLTEEWLYNLIGSIVWPEEEPKGFEQLSKKALEETWNFHKPDVLTARQFDDEDYVGTTNPRAVLHAGLVTPRANYVVDTSQLDRKANKSHEHYCQPNNWAEINTTSDVYLGEVLHFTPNARGQHADRLMQSVPKSDGLPQMDGGEELTIRLSGEEFAYLQPYIPGYRLAGKTGDTWGFVPDEMGDPYASADIGLTPEQQSALAERYAEAGLHSLAQLINQKSRLSVQDLVSLVSEKSASVTSSQAAKVQPPLPASMRAKTLNDFRDLVRDGVLQVQCTGAAQFLKFSLEEVFGKSAAMTASGYRISRRNISTSARHTQTIFTYKGQTYLLDATPRLTEEESYNDYLFADMHAGPLMNPLPPLASPNLAQVNTKVLKTAESISSEQLREQKIQAIRRSLDVQLLGLFNVPERDFAYEKVNALPGEDPFRITVETILRATYGEVIKEEAERLYRYLGSYQKADETLRRQMGVASYDNQTVQLLQSTAKQLLDQF